MERERWLKVERLYHAARERDASERSQFLSEACAGDESLRGEVESLLAQAEGTGSFMGTPAWDVAARALAQDQARAAGAASPDALLGRTVLHYRILEKLGAGGMGEVYLAHDQKLDREVAVKILPETALGDASIRRRLRKEAQALSKLSHPNIETLFDFVSTEGVEFLVVEYVAGRTLSDMLQKGPLPEREIARLGVQLADGVAAAHDQSIIHRDLKPANLRVTADGRLKILDFGIAKFLKPRRETIGTGSSTDSSTGQNAVGTVPYMAPEQLLADAADARTDVYGAGTVLYEMATGQRPFREETQHRLTEAILHSVPVSPRVFNPGVSPELERIILKCLQKEPENRYPSARDLEVDLRQLAVPKTAPPVPPVHRALTWWRAAALAAIPVVVVAAILAALNVGGSWNWLRGKKASPLIASIAVLPLENLSHDPEQEYFADGMTEALIGELSQIRPLRVISRTSVMQYKGQHKPTPQIAEELKVDAVVEGTVLRSADRVRISAQLVQVNPEKNLWAESYERDVSDVLGLQREVARAIADEVQIQLSPQETSRLQSARAVKPDAYEAYLKGRYFWNKRDREGVTKGLQYFERAAELDPGYALAYAGVADSYIIDGDNEWLPPREAFPKAKEAAIKALEIDDTLAEAHASLAKIREVEWDWMGAETAYKEAIALNPGYATAHQWYSSLLAVTRRHEEAIAEARRAAELDPLSPTVRTHMGRIYYVAQRYEEARRTLEGIGEVSPDFFWARYFLGLVDAQESKYEESVADLQKANDLSRGDDRTKAALGYAYALSGRKDAAQNVFNELKAQSTRRYVSPYLLALSCVGLNKEEAFQWLDEALKQRNTELPWVGVYPLFDPLRSDARFHALLQRVDLPH